MNRKTLVLGASLKAYRYSNIAIHRLVEKNNEVVAVGLTKGAVAGVEINTGMPEFKNLDTITLYINPRRQEDYYDYIISLNPKRVIFNPGTENQEFIELLRQYKIKAEVACTLVLLSMGTY